jgi:short subunit dehydrogenase-like uncharacterized protein
MASRDHDVVLFGATGFTGRLVAEYLATHAPSDLRVALGGRNAKKLDNVREELARTAPRVSEWPLVQADSHDHSALADVAKSARVVCSTVGPYAKHGHALVAACAEHGTHYTDITGEVQFVRASIDANHERAQRSGAKIVHCAGFDSIPSDLGVFMLHAFLRARGASLAHATYALAAAKGGMSGGTFQSMLNVMEEATRDRAVRRLFGNPYGLNPDPSDRGPDGRDQMGLRWDRELGAWTGPFLMAAVNTRIVRRTNALLGYPYGKGFRYREVTVFKRGPTGLARAALMSGGVSLFAMCAMTRPGRALLEKVLPGSGEGPSSEARKNGFFKVRLFGEGQASDGSNVRVHGTVAGTSDPGYGETAKMLAESTLCLARDSLSEGGGVLTPASAMGEKLIARLRDRGMTFSVELA